MRCHTDGYTNTKISIQPVPFGHTARAVCPHNHSSPGYSCFPSILHNIGSLYHQGASLAYLFILAQKGTAAQPKCVQSRSLLSLVNLTECIPLPNPPTSTGKHDAQNSYVHVTSILNAPSSRSLSLLPPFSQGHRIAPHPPH